MANNRSLSFTILAIEKAKRVLDRVGDAFDDVYRKAKRLDGTEAHARIRVSGDREAMRKIDAVNKRMKKKIIDFGGEGIKPRNLGIAILITAALAALPAAGAVAGGLTALAFGAGLATIGIIAQAKTKRVKKVFKDLKKDVGKQLRDISEPFQQTLVSIADTARDTFRSLKPTLKVTFRDLAPAVSVFLQNLGKSFAAFGKRAFQPMAQAFTDLTGQLGPVLDRFFKNLGSAFADLARTVSENKTEIAQLIGGILAFLVVIVRIVDGLIQIYVWGVKAFAAIKRGVASATVAVLKFARDAVSGALSGLAKMLDALAEVNKFINPLMAAAFRKSADKVRQWSKDTRNEFQKAVDKAENWKETLDRLPQIKKIKGDITDLEHKIKIAKAKLKDPSLTKAQKKRIKGDIQDLERKLATARAKLAKLNAPTTHKIKANIRDLEAKVARAKARLRDPTLTKATRKQIRANIRDLERKIARAKRILAGLKDKNVTVTTYRRNVYLRPKGFIGPVAPQAHGGPVQPNRTYLVGERGPELLTLGRAGYITPNNKLTSGDGGMFEGNLYLDSGEFMGKVRGEIREHDRDLKRKVLAGTGNA